MTRDKKFPSVTVIMPNYHDEAGVKNAIELLLKQDYVGEVKIIVVDNSEQFSLQALQDQYASVDFLWEKKPGSYNARNKALAQTNTDVVTFTDSDCSPHTNWISEGVQCLFSQDNIGLVGGKIQTIPVNKNNPTLAEYYETINAFPQKRYVRVEKAAATANVFTKLSVLQDVGHFNGALKSGGDHEWGKRVHGAGYKILYCGDAIVDHPARIHSEILKKTRRIVAGARDQGPSWTSCVKFVVNSLVPLRKRIMKTFKYKDGKLNAFLKAKIIFYAIFLNLYMAYFRLYLQVSSQKSLR
jgi:cellulose synthase/poly-beta-1,6-N-acetylglucosamine synthase-like glycosyltransferase